MRQRNVSTQLQLKIYKQIDYMMKKEYNSPSKGQEILEKISQSLREEVYQDIYGQHLKQIKLLKLNFSQQFLTKISLYMKELIYSPGEVIYKV